VFARFTKEARTVVTEATAIARERGALRVEAEHLLLAITRGDSPAAAAMRRDGLDHEALTDALAAETTRSLAAVGITADTPAFSPFVESPRFARSAKAALEQSLRESIRHHDRHIGTLHVALAVLRPDRGTVPRALELAGHDRRLLRDAVTYTHPYANP
jgi:ATP-dependent Clp protease ATP-binding subunit ClpA